MRTIIMTYRPTDVFLRGMTRGIIDYFKHQSGVSFALGWAPSLRELSDMKDTGLLAPAGQRELIAQAFELGVPCVALGSGETPGIPQVLMDEPAVGVMAAEHFAGLGLRHFAYVSHNSWPFAEPRGKAFTAALAKRNLPAPRSFMEPFYRQGRRIPLGNRLTEFLIRLPRPCGTLASTDYIALEVVNAAVEAGIRVPDDLAVLGVDNDDIACDISRVPLSSIVTPAYAHGHQAARLLDAAFTAPPTVGGEILKLPPVCIIPRLSTRLVAVEDEHVAAAVRLIRDHAHEPIDVTWVADKIPVSRRSLERKFKQLLGETLLQRLHEARFQAVKTLLAETDLPLKVIAQRTGLISAKWLSDSFRKYVGTTPSAYRKQFRPGIPEEDE